MVNWNFIVLLISAIFATSCAAQKQEQQDGLVKGTIGIYEGNCMPGPGIPPCEPRPISNIIYFTQKSERFNPTLVIDSVQSKPDGSYEISLPVGSYSLFLKDGDQVVCDLIQCPEVCYCRPFEITEDTVLIIDANLDHATW